MRQDSKAIVTIRNTTEEKLKELLMFWMNIKETRLGTVTAQLPELSVWANQMIQKTTLRLNGGWHLWNFKHSSRRRQRSLEKIELTNTTNQIQKKHTFLYEFKAYLKLTDKKCDFNSLLRWHTKRSSLNNLILYTVVS